MPINPKQAIIKYRLVDATKYVHYAESREDIIVIFLTKMMLIKNAIIFRHFLKSGLYFSFAIYALGSHFLCRVPGLGSVK